MSVIRQPFHRLAHLPARREEAGSRTHRTMTHVCVLGQEWIECACGWFGEGHECRVADLERDVLADVARLTSALEAKVARVLALADLDRAEFEQSRRSA